MPQDVVRMLLEDVADVGLATEALGLNEGLVSLPCHEWQHVMVVPASHALAQVERPTLADLAAYPLVLYQATVTGRTRIDQAFERAELKPLVALEAIDSDVIKTYVRGGLGVGIVSELAVREEMSDLVWRPLGHLFGPNMTRVAFKRGAYLRHFVLAFVELLSPQLSSAVVQRALAGQDAPADPGL
jgi:LysR family cys regulon transcriptional activator